MSLVTLFLQYLVEGVGIKPIESNVERLVIESQTNENSFTMEEPETPKSDGSKITSSTPAAKRQKWSQQNDIDTDILKHIESVDTVLHQKPMEKERDEIVLFCNSLVPKLRSLAIKTFRQLKIKIEQLIFNIIYDELLHIS